MDFNVIHDSGIPFVHVLLNGTYDATFLVDTGGFTCSLSDEVVKKLGLKTQPAYLGQVQADIGNGAMDYTTVSEMQVGGFRFKDFRIAGDAAQTVVSLPGAKD